MFAQAQKSIAYHQFCRFLIINYFYFVFENFQFEKHLIFVQRRVRESKKKKLILFVLFCMHSEIEIKQDLMNYVLLFNNINFNQKFILFRVFVDCDIFNNAFIDQFFAQKQDFELLSLKHSIELSVFDESNAKSELITHYCYFFLSIDRRHRVIKFYIIFLFQWKIILELFWLKVNRVIFDFNKLQMIYFVNKFNVII